MSEDARRVRMAEDLLRHFSACAKAAQLYAPGHPIVKRAVDQLKKADSPPNDGGPDKGASA